MGKKHASQYANFGSLPYFNGKVIVQVDPPYKDSIQISREKINALKIWLDS